MQRIEREISLRVPESKAHPATAPQHVVERPRLLRMLRQAARGRVTLLVAPAGSGKSTLLAQYANEVGHAVCWYGCDPADADPATFVAGLTYAASTGVPAIRSGLSRVSAALAGNAPPSVILGLLATALEESTEPVLLILDDAHHLAPSPETPSLLPHLVDLLPAHVHLIVASRTVPAVPLVLLTGLGQASGLGQQDLRFAEDEAASLLRALSDRQWADEDIRSLVAQTQGWATALILYSHLAVHGAAGTPPRAAVGTLVVSAQDALFGYIATTVMAELPRRLRRFLFDVAVFEIFSADDADAVRGRADSDQLLRAVAAQGLFLEQLPGGMHYRFHDLFRGFLQSHLRATAPERWRRLHRKVALRAEAMGDGARALRHMAEGGTPAALADLLERLIADLIDAGQWHLLVTWCERIPQPLRTARPALPRAHAHGLLTVGRVDAALGVLDKALAAATGKPSRDSKAAAEWLSLQIMRANALFQVSRFEDAVSAADTGLEQSEPGAIYTAYLRQIRGCALVRLGSAVQGIAEVQQALDVFARQGQDEQIASICHNVGQFLLDCGDARAAQRYLDRAMQVEQALGRVTMLSLTLLAYGLLHYLRGQPVEARARLGEALEAARKNGHVLAEVPALESLGTLAAEQGRVSEARRYLKEAEDLALPAGQRFTLIVIRCAWVRVCLAENDVRAAASHVEAVRGMASLPGEQGLARLMAGILALHQDHLGAATELLEDAAARLGAAGIERHRARALLLLAAVSHATGALSRALLFLNEVAEIVERLECEGFLHAERGRVEDVLLYARDHPRIRVGTQALIARLLAVPLPPALSPAGTARRATSTSAGYRRVTADVGALRVVAFGAGHVYAGDAPLPPSRWVRGAARELFFFALAQNRPLSRDALLDALRPDDMLGDAQATFWAASHQLRRTVPGIQWVRVEGKYTLTLPSGSTYDVATFETLAAAALDPTHDLRDRRRRVAAEEAVHLYSDEYLTGMSAGWVLPLRMRLHEQMMELLLFLAGAYEEAGQPLQAVDFARRAVAADPLEERAQRVLIETHLAAGDRTAAVRAYEAYSDLHMEDVGEPPAASFQVLYQRLISGKPADPGRPVMGSKGPGSGRDR